MLGEAAIRDRFACLRRHPHWAVRANDSYVGVHRTDIALASAEPSLGFMLPTCALAPIDSKDLLAISICDAIPRTP